MSLRQAFAHCAIFPTAASRRSLGRISVPVWPITLSGRLPIIALVSRYLTNKLIGRRFILKRKPCGYLCYINHAKNIKYSVLAFLSESYPNLQGRLPTRYSPVRHWLCRSIATLALPVRLACIMHTVSVSPEPGSNSQKKLLILTNFAQRHLHYLVLKEQKITCSKVSQ